MCSSCAGKRERVQDLAALAGKLHRLTNAAGVPLIINDHPEIARDLPVEGLHLGQDDLPIAQAREIVGAECWIGKSTHSLAQATAAIEEGADYIGFGPLFATPTKPDYPPIGMAEIRRAHEPVQRPVFALGDQSLEPARDFARWREASGDCIWASARPRCGGGNPEGEIIAPRRFAASK